MLFLIPPPIHIKTCMDDRTDSIAVFCVSEGEEWWEWEEWEREEWEREEWESRRQVSGETRRWRAAVLEYHYQMNCAGTQPKCGYWQKIVSSIMSITVSIVVVLLCLLIVSSVMVKKASANTDNLQVTQLAYSSRMTPVQRKPF
ncbi:hypothetical protein B0I72DRAFT_131291 [Yarrowia lipolytica]|nr:hypothetical protein B0I72DRAFT_131291 [Yarrowia lipolytica]RDW47755.1 hypothetical protein B0I74DRAFT_126947 [Yarrowia lipolytica]RDW53975.1 hypothetical protein B0I75DRAFT_127288 [Yarrowia lipolytica]